METQPLLIDQDPLETQEWRDALDSVIAYYGQDRAQFIVDALAEHAGGKGLASAATQTPYVNTLRPEQKAALPDDGSMLLQLINYMRWNAMAMVMRAGKRASELGGHIATYGSSAILFEVGLNYFFHAASDDHLGDLVYFQGHASPGLYARAYLEGRLSEAQLDNFRQESFNDGLSSYPHPWLMPEFWQLPTVSMGLGPLMAIYQAQFLKYLHNRKLANSGQQHIWAFCGDGELGEPESLGALNIAAREGLDNLTFVISCNLQRLDGPVAGNVQIIQEYEGVFRGAGWNVIKVIWGENWQALFAKDTSGILMKRIGELVDGEQQAYSANGGAYMREHFFGKYPQLAALVADMSDEDLSALTDGGHDLQEVYAAYQAALNHKGKPTVVLAKTLKGYGMGSAGRAKNITHQTKKVDLDNRLHFRDHFKLPLSDDDVDALKYLPLEKGSDLEQYLQAQRQKLGGYLPARSTKFPPLAVPELSAFDAILQGSSEREISTTMAFVRCLGVLLKDKNIKERIVPIMADESRTFGMEGLFRQIGIYSPLGQCYTPEDKSQLMYYRENTEGQLLQQGISEAGGMSSWIAAATSYAHSQCTMIPFFVYYSMFGYQRFGDLVWAAGDAQARGFIMGGTAGRTTLAGEGLQHQDGHNLLMFSMVPNCMSYDPCFSYELAVILQDGLKRMYQADDNVFYYITLMNENYTHPKMPAGVEEGIIKGMYPLETAAKTTEPKTTEPKVTLLGAGTILREVIKAAAILEEQFNVAADIWSVTSFNELRRDCEAVSRHNRLHPKDDPKQSYVSACLGNLDMPIIAATDYIKLYAEQIRQDIPAPYYVLGTDGYGRSDTRAALRDFFEVNANMIAYTALKALADQGSISVDVVLKAQATLSIDINRPLPTTV